MKKHLTLLLIVFVLVFINNACTIIGGYIGYKSREVEYTKSDNKVLNLSVDEEVKVIKQNSDTLTGRFVKFNKTPYDDYSKSYSNFVSIQSKKLFLPGLEQKLSASINNYNNNIIFRGFDFGTIYYSSENNREIKSLPIKNIGYLKDSTEKRYTMGPMLELLNENRIPLYTQLVLKNDKEPFEVKSDDISKISFERSSSLFLGAALGAVVDVLVYFIVRDKFSLNFNFGSMK